VDPFVAEIRIFGFNFAPKGWATCDGQIMPISQNTALFALLGTTYGGDGKTTFALPNLGRSAPMHAGNGQGPGLSERFEGEVGGAETVTLLQTEIPSHTHALKASPDPGDNTVPGQTTSLAGSIGGSIYGNTSSGGTMAPEVLTPLVADGPHNNMQPYLALNFCIALQGVFPPRP
jgi:microcystin-dependent protein